MFDFCLEKSWNQIGIENWGIKSENILNIFDILGGKFVNLQLFQFSFDEFFFEIVILKRNITQKRKEKNKIKTAEF